MSHSVRSDRGSSRRSSTTSDFSESDFKRLEELRDIGKNAKSEARDLDIESMPDSMMSSASTGRVLNHLTSTTLSRYPCHWFSDIVVVSELPHLGDIEVVFKQTRLISEKIEVVSEQPQTWGEVIWNPDPQRSQKRKENDNWQLRKRTNWFLPESRARF